MSHAPVPLKALIAAATIVCIWPTAFSVIKIGLEYFSPIALVAFRLIIAALVMIPYVTLRKYPIPRGKDGILLALSGICGVTLYALMINFSIETISAGQSAFLVAINPIFVVLMCRIFLGEKFGIKTASGMAIAIAGVAMLTLQGTGGLTVEIGTLFALLGGLSFALYIMIQKPLLEHYSADMIGAYSCIFGGLACLPFLPAYGAELLADVPLKAHMTYLFLAIISTVGGYLVWAYALSHLSRVQASTIVYLLPVSATFHAMWLVGERMTPTAWLGGALVLLGVFIVNVRKAQKKALVDSQ